MRGEAVDLVWPSPPAEPALSRTRSQPVVRPATEEALSKISRPFSGSPSERPLFPNIGHYPIETNDAQLSV
jgi:hypothetical protein